MQDDISTSSTRTNTRSKKSASSNGKWVQRQDAEMDNEAFTPSTLADQTTSTASISRAQLTTSEVSPSHSTFDNAMAQVRSAYDMAISRGSDLIGKVDLSRGTNVIREYPIQAAVGGLIVGFLLGAAVFSSRREA